MADLSTVLTSSGVASVVVFGGNALLQYWKDTKARGHVYFEIVLQLESFAQRCNARLYDIDQYLGERADRMDETGLTQPEPLAMSFAPEPDWKALPIKDAARIRGLSRQYANANEWVGAQFNHWADTEDAYRLAEQVTAYYGLRACDIAVDLRKKLKLAEDSDAASLRRHLAGEIDAWRMIYAKSGPNVNLIPELEARFDDEQS